MENVFKGVMISLVVLPMLFIILVAIFSAILVIADIPTRNR